jgi:hypothetical protein
MKVVVPELLCEGSEWDPAPTIVHNMKYDILHHRLVTKARLVI